MPPRLTKPPRWSCRGTARVKSLWTGGRASLRAVLLWDVVRCYVEPSPAGGYFVRIRGEAAPVSHHDTEEEAEAAATAYERGLAREDTVEHVLLADGAEVLSSGEPAPETAAPGSSSCNGSRVASWLSSSDDGM